MSKASLKKELSTFDKDQLLEVILNVYSSSKEAKEYLEFFLNPDADALRQKKIDILAKEINRSKRGYSKARISVIRRIIKDFAAFGIGPDQLFQLQRDTVRMLIGMERFYIYPATLTTGTAHLAADMLVTANSAGMLQTALDAIDEIFKQEFGRRSFKDNVFAVAYSIFKDKTGFSPK